MSTQQRRYCLSRKVKRSDIPFLKQPRPKPRPNHTQFTILNIFLLLLLIQDSSARLSCVPEKCECLCHQIWLQGPPPLSPSGVNLSLSFPIKRMGTRVIILQRCWKNYREFIYKAPGTMLVINKRQFLLITGTTEMGGKRQLEEKQILLQVLLLKLNLRD